jgi:hypothetical protein
VHFTLVLLQQQQDSPAYSMVPNDHHLAQHSLTDTPLTSTATATLGLANIEHLQHLLLLLCSAKRAQHITNTSNIPLLLFVPLLLLLLFFCPAGWMRVTWQRSPAASQCLTRTCR